MEIERGKNKVISIQLNEPISKTFSTLNTEKQSFIYSKYIFKKLYLFLVRNQVKKTRVNPLERSINVNFLRKERLYTKLKYSRSPAYDIVSGGAAALLAGFIGFLISEKYGFELVDSGDFYYLFMYLVFIAFSVRPLLTSINFSETLLDLISPKLICTYYLTVISLFFKK